jgi:hypothetical protein
MWQAFLRWLLVWLGLIRRPAYLAREQSLHPTPEELTPGTLVLVIDDGRKKWVCFRCPCGCDQRIQLSLNPECRPRWSVSVDWLGRLSVSPSVHQLDGCRSHFWIRRGAIDWCLDSGQRTTFD